MRMRAAFVVVLAVLLGGCDGVISDPGGGPGGSGGGSGGGPGTEPGDPRFEVRVWRLSPLQYDNEIERFFGPEAPDVDLPEGAAEHGITNIAGTARIDLGNATRFVEAARTIGTWVAAEGATAARCDAWGTAACMDTFLDWFPEAAFRRPLSAEERTELRMLFEDLSADYTYEYAFAGVVRAVLLSPSFLYRWELGGEGSGVVELGQYEIASLIALSLTDRGPDDELLADAAAGALDDPDVREGHVRRLMGSSAPIWQRFFWEWLEMSTLESQGNEVGLPPVVVAQMEEEFRTFVEQIVVEDRGTLRDLLTTDHTWTGPELAAHYGVSHSGTGQQLVEMNSDQRAGLLTQGAWLVSHGRDGRDNVVRRGMGVFRDAMCNDIEPLDIDLEAALSELVGDDATVREVVEARGMHPTCGACHRLADPVGLAFEAYGGDGAWQTTYADGLPVETDITLDGVGALDGPVDLSAALADDLDFQHCFVQRFAHFVMGIDVGSPEAIRWTREAHENFVANEGSFEELLVAIVRDPAFIERRKE